MKERAEDRAGVGFARRFKQYKKEKGKLDNTLDEHVVPRDYFM